VQTGKLLYVPEKVNLNQEIDSIKEELIPVRGTVTLKMIKGKLIKRSKGCIHEMQR
jgi:hypothetical protein